MFAAAIDILFCSGMSQVQEAAKMRYDLLVWFGVAVSSCRGLLPGFYFALNVCLVSQGE